MEPADLNEDLSELINAGFVGIWVQTREPHVAVETVNELCEQSDWLLYSWDIDRGWIEGDQSTRIGPADAARRIRSLHKPDNGHQVLILHNWHLFLDKAETIQATLNSIPAAKDVGLSMVVISPVVKIPVELEKFFKVIEHGLPAPGKLETVAHHLIGERDHLKDQTQWAKLCEAGRGLTAAEFEDACSLSLARHDKFDHHVVRQIKIENAKKGKLISQVQSPLRFADIGGNEAAKTMLYRSLTSKSRHRPTGSLFVGPPGTGKTVTALAAGNEVDLPDFWFDVSSMTDKHVGESERRMREGLEELIVQAPCIAVFDELEKAFSGLESSTGTTAHMLGTLLTRWQDLCNAGVYIVGTANSAGALPTALLRRFAAMVFVDIPTAVEREKIWPIHLKKYVPDRLNEKRPNDTDWTGADIEKCCLQADIMGLSLIDAARYVVPVAVTGAEEVAALRDWANNRCISANYDGVYRKDALQTGRPSGRRTARSIG
jgi:hypothetical protein